MYAIRSYYVHLDYLNTQGQPKYEWPASFVLAKAYVDQLERNRELSPDRIASVRTALNAAEGRTIMPEGEAAVANETIRNNFV